MSTQIFSLANVSNKYYIKMLKEIKQGYPVMFEVNPLKLGGDLIEKHQGLFPWHFRDSIRSFNDPSIIDLNKYEFSYANRISEYFTINQLERAMYNFKHPIVLWDPAVDLNTTPRPCLMMIKFFAESKVLNMQVVFRRRDLIRRMIPNWFCLGEIQRKVAEERKMTVGILYDYSLDVFYNNDDKKKWEESK